MKDHYKERHNMMWDPLTSDEMIDVLEKARQNNTRLHLSFGYTAVYADSVVGLDWLEECDNQGYIGQSPGKLKVPVLFHNVGSYSGRVLRDHCIVRIRTSCGGQVLWQHPSYHHGKITIHRKLIPLTHSGGTFTVDVRRDGKEQAAFKDIASAWQYVTKLGLTAERVRDSEAAST